jgi:hypothetical protein
MPSPTKISDAELGGLLKNVYANYREKVQNYATPLLSQMEKGKAGGARNMRWGGNDIFWDIVVGRASGSTFSPDGYFPNDTTAQEVQARSGVVRAYTTRQIDGLAFVGTTSKQAAFETIVRKTMEEIKDASRILMQQALHNKANGVVALVSSYSAGPPVTVVVNSPYGLANAGQGSLLISIGDTIAIIDPGVGNAVRGRAQVTNISVSGDNATLTLSAAISGTTSADLVVKATASDTSFNGAMNGLISITNRGGAYNSLHGQSAATYPIWNAVQASPADANQPTESDLWDLFQRINGLSGKDPMSRPQDFFMLTTPGIGKKLMESMIGQRRFTVGEFATNIKGGYKGIEVCGVKCYLDYYVPAGTIYVLHMPSLAWVDAKDWGFVEFEGAGPWRWLNGRDAFETTYGWYGNVATLARNAHGSITGYTDTVRYSHVV